MRIHKITAPKIKMKLNIIHLPARTDRLVILKQELENQKITNFQLWDGIPYDTAPWTGISRAHKQIVREAHSNCQPHVLIGEDDVKFTAPGAFDYFLSNIPRDFDLYLGGIMHGTVALDNTVKEFSGTMLYLIHEHFYETFLTIREDQNFDRALANKGRFLVCHPMVATQYDGYSDNVKRITKYEPYIKHYSFYTGINLK